MPSQFLAAQRFSGELFEIYEIRRPKGLPDSKLRAHLALYPQLFGPIIPGNQIEFMNCGEVWLAKEESSPPRMVSLNAPMWSRNLPSSIASGKHFRLSFFGTHARSCIKDGATGKGPPNTRRKAKVNLALSLEAKSIRF